MKVYKCVISGDELFTDSDHFLVEGGFYVVKSKFVTRSQDDVQLAGSNPSAEEVEESTDSAVESGIDVVLNNRLVETGFGAKKDYQTYMKSYMKRIMSELSNKGLSEDDIAKEKADATDAFKVACGKFKDLQFYAGESLDPEGIIGLLEWIDVEDDGKTVSTPYFYFYKAGVREEKF